MKDKDKLVVMATLLRNNFDFTSLQKSIGTKVTKTLKENLQNNLPHKKANIWLIYKVKQITIINN